MEENENRLYSGTIVEATEWIFSAEGPLVAAGYEPRVQQREMAAVVARRLDDREGLALVENPTGGGKGLAYLVPGVVAALRARKKWLALSADERRKRPPPRLIVSTANIALQSQLVQKDVPGLAAALGVPIRAAVGKSVSNYVCRAALLEAQTLAAARREDSTELDRLAAWAADPACTGDKEEVPWDVSRTWARASVASGECSGQKCPYFDDEQEPCFGKRAQAEAALAEVFVVNHHYLGHARPRGGVLLAVDEAHELEAALRPQMELRPTIIDVVGRKLGSMVEDSVIVSIQGTLRRLFGDGAFAARNDRVRLFPGWTSLSAAVALRNLQEAAAQVELIACGGGPKEAAAELAKLFLANLIEKVSVFVEAAPTRDMQGLGEWVVWVESEFGGNGRCTFHACPIDAAPAMARLRRAYPRMVLTSATLRTGGNFGSFRSSLGIADPGVQSTRGDPTETDPLGPILSFGGPAEELALPSPYPLESMGVLVVPHGPDPKDGGWPDWVDERVVEAVKAAKGRTLVLCSSSRAVKRIADVLRSHTPYTIRAQGEAGRGELRQWFKADVTGVLVGSKSFYAGLDVAGEACSCVVIDRIPFDPPGDPLEEAIGDMLANRTGASAFVARSLPKTARDLAQAAGRLIRSQKDRGAVVVLDRRVLQTSALGHFMRSALPPFPVSREIEDVANAIEGRPLVGVGAEPAPSAPKVDEDVQVGRRSWRAK